MSNKNLFILPETIEKVQDEFQPLTFKGLIQQVRREGRCITAFSTAEIAVELLLYNDQVILWWNNKKVDYQTLFYQPNDNLIETDRKCILNGITFREVKPEKTPF